MKYKLIFEKNAIKQLSKIDKLREEMIYSYLEKNLENVENPRRFGKPLKGSLKDYWRYRVGDYRIVAEINDRDIKIIIIEIGHRSSIYK